MQLFQFQFQAADTDRGCQLLGTLVRTHTVDFRRTVRNHRAHSGRAHYFSVIVNSDCFSRFISGLCCFRKLHRSLVRQIKLYHKITGAHLIRSGSRLCVFNVDPVQYDGTVRLDLFDRPVQHIGIIYLARRFVGLHGITIVIVPFPVLLPDKVKRTGLSKLF